MNGQFCSQHFLIVDLKAVKFFTSFNYAGTLSQITGPKNDRLSIPLYTVLTGGTGKCDLWRSF